MYKIYVIGISPGAGPDDESIGILSGCVCVFASNRHRPLLSGFDIEVLAVEPVYDAMALIAEKLKSGNVAVLATGDPLFFGIGKMIVSVFGSDRLVVKPGVSSMQLAFSRFRESWDDAVFFSLHGRSEGSLFEKIISNTKTFCFTDSRNSPSIIARAILKGCMDIGDPLLADNYTMMVAEDLGSPRERLVSGYPSFIAESEFDGPNVLIIKKNSEKEIFDLPEERTVFGIGEDEIIHSRGLITKNEVRAASIHALNLPRSGVMWDIGAGSGSISIEAASISPGLKIFAIERSSSQIKNILANRLFFKISNICIAEGEAPLVLSDLPDPDRVFVGGSGGGLPEIIETVSSRLKYGGRMVLNAVTPKTKKEAPVLMHRFGLDVNISEIGITRRSFPDGVVKKMNPISVISGKK